MNTLIDIVKSDPGYFAMLLVTLIGGFGMGCAITEAIFRWEGDNDEEDIHKGAAVAGKIKDTKAAEQKDKEARIIALAEKLHVKIGR